MFARPVTWGEITGKPPGIGGEVHWDDIIGKPGSSTTVEWGNITNKPLLITNVDGNTNGLVITFGDGGQRTINMQAVWN